MAKYRFVRTRAVRQLVSEHRKRCGADFLYALDVHIDNTIRRCCAQWNGSKKTLDATVVNLVIGKIRTR